MITPICQITFIPSPGAVVAPADQFNVTFFNHSIALYTHSYLCFGATTILQQLNV